MKVKTNKPSQRLRKNTARTIGIIVCSLVISLFQLSARTYEIQFHTIKLHQKLDYTRLERAGVDKIIYRVFQDNKRNGGLYFNNTQFKTLSPSLEKLITEFDYVKLQLCAWMITRKFKWFSDSFLYGYRYQDGIRSKVSKLDIFNPEALNKILAVYKELASHKIDCILIQDDLILRYNEGFSSWGKAAFTKTGEAHARETDMMKRDTPLYHKWNSVKTDQIARVVSLIVKNCKKVNSAIKVGMNIYYETPAFPEKGEAWYAHNLEKILDTGIDYIYLMSYHRQIKNEMKLSEAKNMILFKELVEKAFKVCGDKLVVKVQIRDWKTGRRIPASEIRTYLNLIPPQVKRVCLTPAKIKDYPYLEEVISGAAKDYKKSATGAAKSREKILFAAKSAKDREKILFAAKSAKDREEKRGF